jgi:dipeptidyl aminopeptidase/acylaminoacyl peptidase
VKTYEVMVCNLNPEKNYEDEWLIKEYKVNDWDIVKVYKDGDLYYTVDYQDGDGNELCLYESQVVFPVKSTELAKFMYPDAEVKGELLFIKNGDKE